MQDNNNLELGTNVTDVVGALPAYWVNDGVDLFFQSNTRCARTMQQCILDGKILGPSYSLQEIGILLFSFYLTLLSFVIAVRYAWTIRHALMELMATFWESVFQAIQSLG